MSCIEATEGQLTIQNCIVISVARDGDQVVACDEVLALGHDVKIIPAVPTFFGFLWLWIQYRWGRKHQKAAKGLTRAKAVLNEKPPEMRSRYRMVTDRPVLH